MILTLISLLLLGGSWPSPGPGHANYGGGGGSLTIVQTCSDTELDNASSCTFGSNVTSGNLIICSTTSEDDGTANSTLSQTGTATISAWTERVNLTTVGHGDCEIDTASVTGTGTLSPSYAYGGGNYSSFACYEVNGGSLGTAVADGDTDSPQQETITLSFSTSYLFGAISDFGAVGAITLTSTPALTNVVNDHQGGRYSTVHYRTTNTINSSPTVGVASPNSAEVGHCVLEYGLP